MTQMIASLTAALLLTGGPVMAVEVHVAPDGDDANAGTAAKPFATIGRAQRALREAKGGAATIHAGTYRLSEPLTFGPKDSNCTYTAAPGQAPVISGGRLITGWERREDGTWTTTIDAVKRGGWYFRQLTVNGRRAVRARQPNPTGDRYPVRQVVSAAISAEIHRLGFNPGIIRPWRNVADIEFVAPINWKCTRQRLRSIDPAKSTVTFAPPYIVDNPSRRFKPKTYGWFENAVAFLDQPGEWYLDRQTGVLTYRPREGEDRRTAAVIAPVLERRLIDVKGTAESPVRNLHFKGLAFADVDWPLPPQGHHGAQATIYLRADYNFDKKPHPKGMNSDLPQIEAAVRFQYAHDCSVTAGRIVNVGGGGVALRRGCRDCAIEGNEIAHVGANGVMVGENWAMSRQTIAAADVPTGNAVRNNHIHHCGLDYLGGIGVWNSYSSHATTVAHNLVHDIPYIGVSVGSFSWSHPKVAHSRDHVIAFNHIHHVMQWLADGGGIFTQGVQPGTALRGNLIHDVERSTYLWGAPNNGIFMDENSQGILVEKNVIYDTTGTPIRFHRAKGDTIRENTLATPTGTKPYTYNRTDPKSITYEANRIVKRNTFTPPDAASIGAGLEQAFRRRLLEPSKGTGL